MVSPRANNTHPREMSRNRTHMLLTLINNREPIVDEGEHRRIASQHGIGVGASEARKVVITKQGKSFISFRNTMAYKHCVHRTHSKNEPSRVASGNIFCTLTIISANSPMLPRKPENALRTW